MIAAHAEVVYLDWEDLYAVIDAVAGDPSTMIRDPGLLAAAIARPQASVFGEDAYPTLADKAAALTHSLVTSHPLLDGNKRVGLVAVRLFYALNGVTTRASQDEKVELIMAIADGTLRDVAKIAAVLRTWDKGSSGSPSDP